MEQEQNQAPGEMPENGAGTGSAYAALGIVVVALVVAGGYYFLRGAENLPDDGPASQSMPVIDKEGNSSGVEEMTAGKGAEVTYSDDGFSPAEIEINRGDSVRFTNTGDLKMWVASAMHPTHDAYDGTSLEEHCPAGVAGASFDQCENGDSYEFTFDKAGAWKYHNHSSTGHFGSIIVK